MFEKLKFWKHKELDNDLGKEINLPEFNEFGKSVLDVPPDEFGKPTTTTQYGKPPFPESEMRTLRESAPNMPQGVQPQWQGYRESSELQVISAKLDALKAALDSINQRLANLERIAQGEQPEKRWQYR